MIQSMATSVGDFLGTRLPKIVMNSNGSLVLWPPVISRGIDFQPISSRTFKGRLPASDAVTNFLELSKTSVLSLVSISFLNKLFWLWGGLKRAVSYQQV